MRKGFIGLYLLGSLAITTLVCLGIFGYRYQNLQPNFGATIATTSVSDTIGLFRTNVNSSFENVNTQLVAISSTIAGYGDLITLNSPLPVANGGTGLTTGPAASTSYLGASGTIPIWKTLVGGSGITLTESATNTVFSTVGFDSTLNIAFTGNNSFAATSTFNAPVVANGTSTFNAPVTFTSSTNFTSTASTTFVNLPLVPTSTPTSDKEVTSKFYVDSRSGLFLAASSTTSDSISAGSFVNISTSTFSLSTAGRLLLMYSGTFINTSNSDGCTVRFAVDGSEVGPISSFQYMPGTGANSAQPVALNYISNSLSTGSHTVNVLGRVVGGGACTTGANLDYIQYIGN